MQTTLPSWQNLLKICSAKMWGRKWRFTFGVSPEKSVVVIFGPSRRTPSCSVTLSNLELPVVRANRHLGVILTPSLSWSAHTSHLTTRGLGLFAQSTTWSRSEGLPVSFGRFLMSTNVLPSAAFGLEFAGETPSSLSVFDRSLRRWGRHVLRWAAGTPNASVLSELALFDSLRMAHGQALSLYGCLTTLDLGTRAPAVVLPVYLALGCIGVDLSCFATRRRTRKQPRCWPFGAALCSF